MRKFRNALIVVALFAVMLVLWAAFQPLPPHPNLSIKHLGYTNDISGFRLALFAITNLNSFQIYVYFPRIQMLDPSAPIGVSNYFQGNTNQWIRLHTRIEAGKSVSFVIPPPTDETPWRISFYTYTDFGIGQRARNFIHRRQHPFVSDGEWIGKTNQ
jgi:hypothetical protein